MQKISDALVEKIRLYTQGAVKASRYEHSVRVAQTAKMMCERYSLDAEKGYLAGLSHDMCKDLDDLLLLSFAERDGYPISKVEEKKPALLHGRAAAVKLKESFGIDDEEILEAVRWHTFGGENLCALSKVIYAADKIEPGRPNSSPEYVEELLEKSLDALCLTVVEENLEYLRKKGKAVAPVTLKFRDALKMNVKEESE